MQTNQRTRPSQVQSPNTKSGHTSGKYRKEDVSTLLVVLGALCLLLPPVGILLTWRARKVDLSLRGIFSAAALASATLIFFLLMRPRAIVTDIRPVPETPKTIGYEAVAASEPAGVPAQPAAVAPAAPSQTEPPAAPQEGGALTDDTLVYAVTNNASSYHLYELCDQQENRRALTLKDALSEGLAPCEKCIGAMG